MADPVNTGFDPEFGGPLAQFRAALKAKHIDTNIISGVRSDEDQRQLVANRDAGRAGLPLPYPARGPVRVAAPVGSSVHEIGLGADVQPVHPGDAAAMHKLAQQFGLAMPNWGGNDPYHVQLANWQDAAASQAPNTPWGTLPNQPSQYASNTSAETPSADGGFKIPGTTIDGSAPIPGALSRPSTPTPGTPVNDFYHTSMMHETGGKNVGNAAGGAAGGYYQFMPGTWAGIRKARPDLNLPPNVMDATQDQQTAGYHEFTRGNVAALQAAGVPITDKNVFMASFLGSGGAPKFFSQMGKDASANAAALFPAEAKSNPTVFYDKGQPRTLQQVYDLQTAMHGSGNTTGYGPDAAPSDAAPAANQQAAADQPWWSKLTQGAIDPATGQVDPNAKTPLQSALASFTKKTDKAPETPQEVQKGAAPDQTALTGAPAPLSRNTSPLGGALLPSASQAYAQRLASFARPLTYNAAPPQAPQMLAAGLQAPGMTLNSLPALPMNPNDMMYGGGYAG